MNLKDISIGVDRAFALPGGMHHRDFNIGTHAAAIAFHKALPKAFALAEFRKINIRLSPKPEKSPTFENQDDVITYYLAGFPFKAYVSSDKTRQEHILLNAIRESLIAVSEHLGVETEPIANAYDEVLAQEFPLDNSWVKYMRERRARQSSRHVPR